MLPAPVPERLLSISCLVLGDRPKEMFMVYVCPTKNVSFLRDMIKEKNAPSLNNFDAKKLRLWKVTLPIDNFDDALSKHPFEEDDLRPQGILGEVFSAPSAPNHL